LVAQKQNCIIPVLNMIIIKIKGIEKLEIQTHIAKGYFVGDLCPAFTDNARMGERL